MSRRVRCLSCGERPDYLTEEDLCPPCLVKLEAIVRRVVLEEIAAAKARGEKFQPAPAALFVVQ